MFNTSLHAKEYSGIYKTIPNMITGINTKVSQPFEVQTKISELLEWYYNLDNITIRNISKFHYGFELIHPFQDDNERIGKFIMLKQMSENNLPLK